MNISYDYYKIFYYAAKYRSFTRAASILFNSQPNVTRAVKNLESELGCTLFVRSNKGAELTPEGQKLYAYISSAVEQIQAGENAILAEKSIDGGTVTVSVTEIALHCHVLGILKSFRSKYPSVRIRLTNQSTVQAVSSVKDGLADIAVVSSPVDIERPLKKTIVKAVRDAAVCSAKFDELKGRRVTLGELSTYPLIMLGRQTKSHEFYSELFMKHNAVLEPEIEVATTNQILPLVKNNLGIGFVPTEFLTNDADTDKLTVIDLAEEIPERYICIVKNTERPSGTAVREFEKMLSGKS